jgi:hypothetical protein
MGFGRVSGYHVLLCTTGCGDEYFAFAVHMTKRRQDIEDGL